MLNIGNRVCIVFGTDCNLTCRYCYRDKGTINVSSEVTDMFKLFLQQLDSDRIISVVASGGEPLLYIEKIKEVFSYVPATIHKKIMTNGILLDDMIIDYINANDIELFLSYDGEHTNYLRGVDVLDNFNTVRLLNAVNTLVINSVTTKMNCDVMRVYEYTVNKLGRDDLLFRPIVVFPNGSNDYLIKDFDYNLYARSMEDYYKKVYRNTPFYSYMPKERATGVNYLLDGKVVSMSDMYVYGDVSMCRGELLDLYYSKYVDMVAKCNKCAIRNFCTMSYEGSCEHLCRCEKIRQSIFLSGGSYV